MSMGAVCNPPEVWQMVDDLLVAQRTWLPQYKKAISAAKKRMTKGQRLKTKTYKGAARKRTRSMSELKKVEKQNPRAGH